MTDAPQGFTPLLYAAVTGCQAAVFLLLNRGANPCLCTRVQRELRVTRDGLKADSKVNKGTNITT